MQIPSVDSIKVNLKSDETKMPKRVGVKTHPSFTHVRMSKAPEMRSLKELKDIVSKLECIEEIKEPLQNLLADINTLLEQGNTWIYSIRNKTYQEMKELLDSEIAKLLKQCFSIASNGQDRFSDSALSRQQPNQESNFVSVAMTSSVCTEDKDNEHILGQIEELTTNVTSHTEMLQTIRHKMKNQEKSLKSASKQTNTKLKEIMEELHAASNFMSNLSEELNETKEQIQEKKIQEISQKVVSCLEQREIIAKDLETVETLNKEIKRLTDELVSAKEMLATQECIISQLKTEKK